MFITRFGRDPAPPLALSLGQSPSPPPASTLTDLRWLLGMEGPTFYYPNQGLPAQGRHSSVPSGLGAPTAEAGTLQGLLLQEHQHTPGTTHPPTETSPHLVCSSVLKLMGEETRVRVGWGGTRRAPGPWGTVKAPWTHACQVTAPVRSAPRPEPCLRGPPGPQGSQPLQVAS